MDLENQAVSLTGVQGLDSATSALIDDSASRLMQTAPKILKGVGSDRVGNDLSRVSQRNRAMGGDDSIYQALQRRNQGRTEDVLGTMKRDITMMSPARELEGLRQVSQNMRAQAGFQQANQQIEMQKAANKYRVKMYRQQQQEALIGGILGIVGTVAGAALAPFTGGASMGIPVAMNSVKGR